MNNIVLFTVRSGSTAFADILSYSTKTINLGESHSCVRDYNYNTPSNKQTDLYKLFYNTNITNNFYNMRTKGGDYIGLFKARKKRSDVLKETALQWTIKEQTHKLTMDQEFVDYWVKSGANIYMTYRKNLVNQFTSFINARYRTEIVKFPESNHFIFTNNSQPIRYNQMFVNYSWLHNYLNVFLAQITLWRVTYEKYKNVAQLVCYEDHVKPMNLEAFGIEKATVELYQNEQQHLVPTPFNTNTLIVNDDHPSPVVDAWSQSLYLVNKHQYLVEV